MIFEEVKYCQECKHCKRIERTTVCGSIDYKVDCKHPPSSWGNQSYVVMYCKYKKSKNIQHEDE